MDGLGKGRMRDFLVTRSAGRDLLAGSVIFAAILMFVGTGATVLPQVVQSLYGFGVAPDNVVVTTLLLNIALIMFGWRRYYELRAEIAVRREAEMKANALAITDPLTGCLNRRTIVDRTADMMAQAAKRQKSVAFLMLDLDNFKTVNDINGHAAGDKVLIEVAKRLEIELPPNSLISRLGGDEFACAFIFDPEAPYVVERVCEHIISRISLPIDGNMNELAVTTSIGIALVQASVENADALMRRADIAMYFSKKHGRNRFTWFDQSMENELQFRNKIESGMRKGIPLGEFVPYFEQQIDLQDGKIIGFEILARWNSPELGLVSPDIFIPVAEETGMISDLSASVIRQALEYSKNWDSSLTISVNISPVQLRDPWLAQKLLKMLVETGFPANRLEVEITESCLFENMGLAQSIVGSLKNQGVRVALDDFGTGYSSLAHLRALPFDRIKIDRSFISSMVESSESAAIVHAITRLGESMGLPITAEGIEDQAIVNSLQKLGNFKGQGYLYGQPQSVEPTRRLLAERNLLVGTPHSVAEGITTTVRPLTVETALREAEIFAASLPKKQGGQAA